MKENLDSYELERIREETWEQFANLSNGLRVLEETFKKLLPSDSQPFREVAENELSTIRERLRKLHDMVEYEIDQLKSKGE